MDPDVSLREQQIAALSFYISKKKSLDLSDPGVGKTPPVVVNQWRRWQDGMATTWVMPKSLLRKNKREILRFTDLHEDEVVILDGPTDRINKHLGRKDVAVWLMGPERFRRIWRRLPDNAKAAMDVDEFHKAFAGNASKRTEEFYAFMRHAAECVFMTGTLIHGRIDTVFPAIHAIEPRYYAGYDSFMNYHAWTDGYGRPFAWKNHDRIAQILSRHSIRFTFEQVYGPESKIIIPEDADMSPRQREYYDEFLRSLTVDLGEAILDGTAPPQTLLVGRKIMEIPFALKDPRGDEFPKIDLLDGELTGKEELLDLHFADHARDGKPFVVFAFFREQQKRIAEQIRAYGIPVAVMNGETSLAQRDRIDLAFQRGELQGVVCSEEVAAFGFNWQDWFNQKTQQTEEVDHFIFVSLDYLDTNFLQAYRRGMRRKRKSPLRLTVLRYRNSMDSRVMDIIHRKSKDANRIDKSREVYRFNDNTEEIDMVA